MRNFSVFALGVSPYITASIVVQLLQMDLLPKFVEWGQTRGSWSKKAQSSDTLYFFGFGLCSIHWDYSYLPHLVSGEISRYSKCQNLSVNRCDSDNRFHDCHLAWRANHRQRVWKWCFNDYLCRDCCFNS